MDKVIEKHVSATDTDKWRLAAQHWRFPFWHWGFSTNVPAICDQPQMTVKMPKGDVKIDNPFYKFTTPGGVAFRKLGVGDSTATHPVTRKEVIIHVRCLKHRLHPFPFKRISSLC